MLPPFGRVPLHKINPVIGGHMKPRAHQPVFTPDRSATMLRRLLLSSLCLCGSVPLLAIQSAQDVKGSKDHPMVSRVEGSTIKTFEQKEFDEYRIITGPVTGHDAEWNRIKDPEQSLNSSNSVPLEG